MTRTFTITRSGITRRFTVQSGVGPAGTPGATDYNELTNKPTLGTASPLDVAATGDAASGEVVKGDDTRLTDARTPTAHTHVSADITDATSAATPNTLVKRGAGGEASFANSTAFAGSVTGTSTSADGWGVEGSCAEGLGVLGVTSGNGIGVYAEALGSGTGLIAVSLSGLGISAATGSGTNHAEFGESTDDRSFVRRVLGLFGWHRGSFTQTLGSPSTLTANSAIVLPDVATGTVALTSNITSAISSLLGTANIWTQTQSFLDFTTNGLSFYGPFATFIYTGSAAETHRTALGLGTLATQSGTFSGTSSGTNTGDQTITLTGDVTGSGTGSFAATIANDAVTFAKMQEISSATLIGRHGGGTGNPQEVSVGNGIEFQGSGIRRSALTGDVTAAAGSDTTTLASVGTAGTYRSVTTDAKGRVTAGTNPTTLSGYGITDAASLTGTETLTNKTLTNPTVTGYTEGVVAIGTVGATHTIDLTNGTFQTATLTASTASTFTMPTATAGKSFILHLKQAAATGDGTATFTGVKWGENGTPVITATAGKMDILTFTADGSNWYGSITQGFTP